MHVNYWTTDLDIDSLESKKSWATLAELQTVIPYHSKRYKTVLQDCKKKSALTATDLTFATRFVAVFMFVKVKGCRKMTYQHLTVQMFENAKTNGGMVDQTMFKTAQKYASILCTWTKLVWILLTITFNTCDPCSTLDAITCY